MRNLSNKNGSISYGETSWETGDTATTTERKRFFTNLINKANSIPILKVFKLYNLKISKYNREIICPFLHHKGGRENSASFYYYPDTNSFWCHGCRTGLFGTNFVANMDKIPLIKAAYKILDTFGSDILDVDDEAGFETLDISERLDIMMDFSNCIREFRQKNTDEKSFIFIEGICKVYDTLNNKHKLDNEALKQLVSKLKNWVK